MLPCRQLGGWRGYGKGKNQEDDSLLRRWASIQVYGNPEVGCDFFFRLANRFKHFFCGADVMAIEEARFTVLKKDKEFELRQYEPQIVAETLVEGNFEEAGNQGFPRLFSYISGNNRKTQSIPMTAPVTQEPDGEKITMTAPVGRERVGEKWRITFLMPHQYTLETLPIPLDPNIRLKTIPGRLMATIRYSGTWSKKNFEENETHLRAWIGQHGLKPAGEPVWARYNPPFTPWFMRRNEILIPVERVQP